MSRSLLSGVAAAAMVTGLVVDNFAGGGGASTGIEAALERAVDYAVNHDDQALAMHLANHPGTIHISNNIRRVKPKEVTKGRKIGLAWFSPDCKDHSKAKGGRPRNKKIRDLAWVVIRWAFLPPEEKPDVIMLENVEEFAEWGPLRKGKRIKERRGETFAMWVQKIRDAGYTVNWRELRACDYGAPTIRKRFFLIARCDGKPIVWPAPTHGRPDSLEVRAGVLLPYRTAAECIDWSIRCPSIFDRKKDLKPATLSRIAHGVMRFVVNNPRPFIIPVSHTKDNRAPHDGAEPLRTATTAKGGELAIVDPFIAPLTHQGSPTRSYSVGGQYPTITAAKRGELGVIAPHIHKFRTGSDGNDILEPLRTATANSYQKRPGGAAPLGLVEAVLSPHITGVGGRRAQSPPRAGNQPMPTGTTKGDAAAVAALLTQFRGSNKKGSGGDLSEPARASTAGGQHQAVVCAHLEQANTGMIGREAKQPLSTIVQKGCTQRIIETTLVANDALPPELMDKAVRTAAFLIKYYGSADHGQPMDEPLGTATALARFAVVTVTIDAETYVLVDIGMRMLKPRELFNAQGFPPDYDIEAVNENGGKPLTITQQIEKCGNSVCPPVAEALVRANFSVAVAAEQQVAA